MEQVLDSLWGLYNGFTGWTPPRETMATVVFFSALASMLITYFTAGSRMFTVPICFIVLFVAGLFSNYLGREHHFPGTSEMQHAIIFSVPGQMVAGFILLLILKTASSNSGGG